MCVIFFYKTSLLTILFAKIDIIILVGLQTCHPFKCVQGQNKVYIINIPGYRGKSYIVGHTHCSESQKVSLLTAILSRLLYRLRSTS
jgi:hypothetical protein